MTPAEQIQVWRKQYPLYGYSTEIKEEGEFITAKATVTNCSGRIVATAHAVSAKDVDSPLEHAENQAILRAIGGFPEPQPPPPVTPHVNGATHAAVQQLAEEHGLKTGDQIPPPKKVAEEETREPDALDLLTEFSHRLAACWTMDTLKAVGAEVRAAGEDMVKAMTTQGQTAKHRVLLAAKPESEWTGDDVDTLLMAVDKAPDLGDFRVWANDRLPGLSEFLRDKFCKADERWEKKHG